jgi:hypothetical protein
MYSSYISKKDRCFDIPDLRWKVFQNFVGKPILIDAFASKDLALLKVESMLATGKKAYVVDSCCAK